MSFTHRLSKTQYRCTSNFSDLVLIWHFIYCCFLNLSRPHHWSLPVG